MTFVELNDASKDGDSLMVLANSGDLMFRCPKTGRDFKSGFVAHASELAAVTPSAQMRARCPECGEPHELRFADGWIRATPALRQPRALSAAKTG
ncbi:MAG: hypothetical protein ACLPX7_27790 [Xanthobacteraceae bacterium]